MQQRRICEYFGLACTHKRTFLCLPPTLRIQIYEEAGLDLFTEGTIDLNWRPEPSAFPRESDNTIFYLLLTCRAVYTELSSVLYSTNAVLIRYHPSWNLQALKILSSTALSAIHRLTVQLNNTTSQPGALCCPTYGGDLRQHSTPFKSSKRRHQEALLEWASVANHVFTHTSAADLRFALICDVEDIKSAERAVKPLLNISSPFAQCDIRLGQSLDSTLQNLAQYAANHATGKDILCSTSPFPFMDLPVELRLQILKYTDLVTPLLEVEWCPKRKFGLHFAKEPCLGDDEYLCCTPELHYAARFRYCRPNGGSGFNSCFCHRRHASYSSACKCWVPPTPLFLVCRALCDHAREVFFSQNRFIITPSEGCDTPADYTPEHLEAFTFFTSIPYDAFRFLRFVEIVFPPFEEDYLRIHEPAYSEWLQTVTLLKDALNLPSVTLRIYMADITNFDHDQGQLGFRRFTTKKRGNTIFQMYDRLIRPLAELNGLGKFFVHLPWPFAHTYMASRRCEADPGFVENHVNRLNGRYERIVMGESYDSSSLSEPGISQWLEKSKQESLYS